MGKSERPKVIEATATGTVPATSARRLIARRRGLTPSEVDARVVAECADESNRSDALFDEAREQLTDRAKP